MANISFLQLEEGQPIILIDARHQSGNLKTYISTGNDYETVTAETLGELESDDPVVEIVAINNCLVDTSCEINVNNDFDGTITSPAMSVVAHEVIGTRPPRRPK
jgi:hypothetical protein